MCVYWPPAGESGDMILISVWHSLSAFFPIIDSKSKLGINFYNHVYAVL